MLAGIFTGCAGTTGVFLELYQSLNLGPYLHPAPKSNAIATAPIAVFLIAFLFLANQFGPTGTRIGDGSAASATGIFSTLFSNDLAGNK